MVTLAAAVSELLVISIVMLIILLAVVLLMHNRFGIMVPRRLDLLLESCWLKIRLLSSE